MQPMWRHPGSKPPTTTAATTRTPLLITRSPQAHRRPSPVAEAGPSRCPLSQSASLFSPSPRHPASPLPAAFTTLPSDGRASPLGQAGGAEAAAPSLWLASGVSGQNVPGRLVSGLRQLRDLDEFLVELPSEMPEELGMKKSALTSPQRRSEVMVAEPQSLPAQNECLELFLDYLPRRYPHLYQVKGEGPQRTVTVAPTGDTLSVSAFSPCPLELCALLVQEDLVIMRQQTNTESGQQAPSHIMSAAVVVFSFSDLPSKLSRPMRWIHAPVPGFETDLERLLDRTFLGLRPEAPLWRNNWGLADSGRLDQPLYGEAARYARRPAGELDPSSLWLKTEYQTLRRLPLTGKILFTVRTLTEPLSRMADGSPGAAAAAATLAASLRGMPPAMQGYKGLGSPEAVQTLLKYLDVASALRRDGD